MPNDQRVVVELLRPPGYEDVHPELVIDDALEPGWPWEILEDDGATVLVAVGRPKGYERAARIEVAREAVRDSWPTWSIVRRL